MTVIDNASSGFDACEFARTFHPSNPELQEDPYPVVDLLRASKPIAYSEAFGGFWIVTRYEDCRYVLRTPELFSSVQNTVPHLQYTDVSPEIPIQLDPPEHGKYRAILNPPLSPFAIRRLEPQMRAVASKLLASATKSDRCEFVTAFAIPYPATIFVPLMGLPESDTPKLLAWKERLRVRDVNERLRASEALKAELEDYFAHIYRKRRTCPSSGDDLISAILSATYAGERPLSESEFVGMASLLWAAGLDTVTAQLSLAMQELAIRPAHRDKLVGDLSLIPGAVEELMRFDSLVNACRKVTRDTELCGQKLRAGEMVMVMYGAAGRDPQQFVDPYTLNFQRDPNRHFGFGAGIHRCVGSHLARLELRVALEEIHLQIPRYRLDPLRPARRHFGFVLGLDDLNLMLG